MEKTKVTRTPIVSLDYAPPRRKKDGDTDADYAFAPGEVVECICGNSVVYGVIIGFSRKYLFLDAVSRAGVKCRVRASRTNITLRRTEPDPKYPSVVGWKLLLATYVRHYQDVPGTFLASLEDEDKETFKMIANTAANEEIRAAAVARITDIEYLRELAKNPLEDVCRDIRRFSEEYSSDPDFAKANALLVRLGSQLEKLGALLLPVHPAAQARLRELQPEM